MTVLDGTKVDGDRQFNQEALNAEAAFSLNGHELINPDTNRGEIVSATIQEAPFDYPEGVKLSEIRVSDPFVAADPEGYELITRHVEEVLEPIGHRLGIDPFSNRTEATSVEERNQLTTAWLSGENLYPLSVWRDNVPTALALDYLTNPDVGRKVVDPAGNVAFATPETAAHWRFVADAIGIRTRADAMAFLTSKFLSETRPGHNVEWLSLASGTAEPSLLAGIEAMNEAAVKMKMTVADWDGRALKVVQGKADELGYEGHGGELVTLQQNILDPNLPTILAEKSGTELYDIVENMGFKEYLPQDGDTAAAFKGQALPQASDFTRNAFKMVKPGGMLISGNMALPRPQLEFVFGAVDWPIINARTEEEVLRIYKAAGILDDPNALVTVHRVVEDKTGLRIYNIVTVEKLS
jgi:hypothetical protein